VDNCGVWPITSTGSYKPILRSREVDIEHLKSTVEQGVIIDFKTLDCSLATSRLLKKGSECFENLSMNGKSSAISKALRSS
jgi:hypothetical protein